MFSCVFVCAFICICVCFHVYLCVLSCVFMCVQIRAHACLLLSCGVLSVSVCLSLPKVKI